MANNFDTNLSSLLKNTLSGAQENASIANNAIIIPIGKRTNMSRARAQIDEAFDKVEKGIISLVDRHPKSAKIIKSPEAKIIPEKRKASASSSGGGSMIAKLIGTVIGAALAMIDQYGKKAQQYISDLVNGMLGWVDDKINTIKKFVEKGWGYIETTAKEFVSKAAKITMDGLNIAYKGISDVTSYVGGKIDSWSDDAAILMDDALRVVGLESDLPTSMIPPNAITNMVHSAKAFLSNMTKMIRDWLWGLFSSATPDGASSSGTNGANSSGEGNSQTSNLVGPIAPIGTSTPTSKSTFGGSIPPSSSDAPGVKRSTADMTAIAADQLRREGVPEANLRAASSLLVGQATAESNLIPTTVHDHGTGYGIYGARLGRRDRMFDWLDKNGYSRDSAEGQMRYMAHEAMTDPSYKATANILSNATPNSLAADSYRVEQNFESPAQIGNREHQTLGAYNSVEGRDLTAPITDPFSSIPYQGTAPMSVGISTPVPEDVQPTTTRSAPPVEEDNSFQYKGAPETNDAYPDHGMHDAKPKPHMQDNSVGMMFINAGDA